MTLHEKAMMIYEFCPEMEKALDDVDGVMQQMLGFDCGLRYTEMFLKFWPKSKNVVQNVSPVLQRNQKVNSVKRQAFRYRYCSLNYYPYLIIHSYVWFR